MKLSERGFRKIKAYEGYHTALPDGGCVAYREEINGKLDIWTIGYGCTKGIDGSTRWTKEQAEEALRAEIAKHETTVNRLVTVELNQNEFDALVSFDYNTGALGKSSLLRSLNKDRREEAAKGFALYNKFNKKPSKGLTSRRADEIALFLEPVEPANEATMPQQVEAAAPPLKRSWVAVLTAGATTPIAAVASDPAGITAKLSAYQSLAKITAEITAALSGLVTPWTISFAAVAGVFGALHYWGKNDD